MTLHARRKRFKLPATAIAGGFLLFTLTTAFAAAAPLVSFVSESEPAQPVRHRQLDEGVGRGVDAGDAPADHRQHRERQLEARRDGKKHDGAADRERGQTNEALEPNEVAPAGKRDGGAEQLPKKLVELISAGAVNSGLFQAMAKTLHGQMDGLKFELDALANKDFQYLTKKYLPRKLKEKDWID